MAIGVAGATAAALCSLVLAVHGGASGQAVHVTVHKGDTLWGIASAHYTGDDTQARISQIESQNHLHGASLNPGQILTLPEP